MKLRDLLDSVAWILNNCCGDGPEEDHPSMYCAI